jgi:hypothetical protein
LIHIIKKLKTFNDLKKVKIQIIKHIILKFLSLKEYKAIKLKTKNKKAVFNK